MKVFWYTCFSLLGIGLLLSLMTFGFGLFGLEYKNFFAPRHADIDRQVFENTKSYLHGVQQELGKYYLEYQTADASGRAALKATIQMRFSEVDVTKLQSMQLQNFLSEMRGY